MKLPEDWGWGRGAIDRDPPIPKDQTRVREVALRHWLEALSDNSLHPYFIVHESDEHSRFVRLLTLTNNLIQDELPRVWRRLRCETIDTQRILFEPAGGKLDPVASLRLAVMRRSTTPDAWVVSRRERFADTPINRLIVKILRETERRINAALRHSDERWQAMAGERSLLTRAQHGLRDFFATTPLGQFDVPKASLVSLRAAAKLRKSEYERIASLDRWWCNFDSAWLDDLDKQDKQEALHAEFCYELCVALGLVLALRRCFTFATATPGRFTFHGAREKLELCFGQPPAGRWGRAPTAALTVHRENNTSRDVLIEARNQRTCAATEVASRLELWLGHEPAARALFLTPSETPPGAEGDRFAWVRFLPELAEGAPCNPPKAWEPLLNFILA